MSLHSAAFALTLVGTLTLCAVLTPDAHAQNRLASTEALKAECKNSAKAEARPKLNQILAGVLNNIGLPRHGFNMKLKVVDGIKVTSLNWNSVVPFKADMQFDVISPSCNALIEKNRPYLAIGSGAKDAILKVTTDPTKNKMVFELIFTKTERDNRVTVPVSVALKSEASEQLRIDFKRVEFTAEGLLDDSMKDVPFSGKCEGESDTLDLKTFQSKLMPLRACVVSGNFNKKTGKYSMELDFATID